MRRTLAGHAPPLSDQNARFLPAAWRGTGSRRARQRLAEIDVELTKVTTKFSENVLDSTNAFELVVTDEATAGRPSAQRSRRRAPERRVEEG